MIPGFDDLTYYEVLDISIGVDNKEIQEAYYRVRAAFSKNSLASYSLYDQDEREQILRLIEEAYHTLIDENSRQEYDQKLSKEKTRLAKEKKALQEVLPLMPGRDEPEVKLFEMIETERAGLSMDLEGEPPEADAQVAFPTETQPPAEPEPEEERPAEEIEPDREPPETTAAPLPEEATEPEPEPEPPSAEADEQTDEAPVVSPSGEEEAEPEPEATESEEPHGEEPAPAQAATEPEEPEESEATPPEEEPSETSARAEPTPETEPEAEPAEPAPPEPEVPSPLNRPVSIRDAQNARERAQASEPSATDEEPPIRIQGRLIKAGDPPPERPPIIKPPARPERFSRPARPADEQTQWSSKGQEPFEETVYDLPEVKKSASPLDFLGASYSGAFLKQVREQKDLTLDQAWEVTRIRKSILQAMEDENYKALPADVFLRGMLIIYSRFLEIENPEGVAKGYMERLVASRDWMD